MTVNQAFEEYLMEAQNDYRSDMRSSPPGSIEVVNGKPKLSGSEFDTDRESNGSSEDMESPRSVSRARKWTAKNVRAFVHSQILRIREEDSHLREDIGEGFGGKDKVAAAPDELASQFGVMLFSRQILPASPLSGKTAISSAH